MTGKYIKTNQGEIILFPNIVTHSDLKHLHPVSAGFFSTYKDVYGDEHIKCYGESISLGLKSEIGDDEIADRQFNSF